VKFDVYGKFRVDIVREGDRWVAYNVAEGKRVRLDALVIPASLGEDELATYLDDLYHEAAKPGRVVRRIPEEPR
jgi:hypothetical protein